MNAKTETSSANENPRATHAAPPTNHDPRHAIRRLEMQFNFRMFSSSTVPLTERIAVNTRQR